jgi:hypothetical protein
VTPLCNIVTEELGQPYGWSSFSLRQPGVRPGAGRVELSCDPANTQIGNLRRIRYRSVEASLIDLDVRCPRHRGSAVIGGSSRDDGRV